MLASLPCRVLCHAGYDAFSPGERSEEHEATALGVALAAGVSAGALGWEQVRDRTSAAEVFTPTLSPNQGEQAAVLPPE